MAAATTSAPLLSTASTLALFGIGALAMRSAGCVVNDLWDRELDAKVARTALRPLASGSVSVRGAAVCLFTQLSVALGVLLILPADCFLLAAGSLGFVATYPLFKRFTYYPQLMLAFTYNWGALLAFPAMLAPWTEMLPAMAALYGAGICWTMIYDTIYAHQDKRDDIAAGIKSTALAWGNNTKPIMTAVATAQIGLLSTAGLLLPTATTFAGPFFLAGVAWASLRIGKMIYQVDLDDPANCWKWFVENIKTGGVIFLGILGQYLWPMIF